MRTTEPTSEQGRADEDDLRDGLRGLASVVAGGRGVSELLAQVAEFAVHAIPGVDGAGVAVLSRPHGKVRVDASAATADFVREIEALQYDVAHAGPCTGCMQDRRPIVSGSLGSDSRWPHFGGRVARMGVHSALSLPLLIADEVIGAINTYAHDRDVFTEHAVALGARFAGPAAVSVYNARLLAQARERAEILQGALGNRAVIDQAIGIVRSRAGGSAEDAFDRLRHISQSENVKLSVVAQRLVDEAVRRAHARHSQS